MYAEITNQPSINSTLFTEAHKMTKLTIKPTETCRYKFGQWLIFLKTAMANKLGITSINQSVCYVPILPHDGAINKTEYNFMFNMLKFICTNPLSLFIIFTMIYLLSI